MLNKKQCLKILFFGFYISFFFGNINNKPANAAEKVECGTGAKVSVVNGVIVCETEKPVPAKTDCDTYNYKTEVVNVYHSDLTKLKSGQELYVPKDKKSSNPLRKLKEAIASLDNPLERVNMDIWAIELASADSARLADVMEQINREIDQTRYAMQLTYKELTNMGRTITVSRMQKMDPKLTYLINKTDVSGDQRLSLMDILFRINMANMAPPQSKHEQPISDDEKRANIKDTKDQILVYDTAANRICDFLGNNSKPHLFARFNQYEGREIKNYEMRSIFTNDPIPSKM